MNTINTDQAVIIEIQLTAADDAGSNYGGRFHALDTTAPADYDGFGTFAVHAYDNGADGIIRTVLVREEHLAWQTARYSSGLKSATPTLHDESAIREAIWNRITGKE